MTTLQSLGAITLPFAPAAYSAAFINDYSNRVRTHLVSVASVVNSISGQIAEQGTATLVAGTATVNSTLVTADSRILLTSNVDGGTPGWLRVSARVAGTSFTITSSDAADTSTVAYLLLRPL